MSYIVQTFEHWIIRTLIDIVQAENHIVGSYQYDGIFLQKPKNFDIDDEVLERWSNKIYDLTRFKMVFKVKPFEVSPLIDGRAAIVQPGKGYRPAILQPVVDYEVKKAIWENIACKIVELGIFLVFNTRGEMMHKTTSLKLFCRFMPSSADFG
jgi:hypothetical protein